MTDDPHNTPLEAVGDEALEARIVAWVLGEASAFEAAELEDLCAKHPEAALFARRMRMLDGLIRDDGAEIEKLPEEKRARVIERIGAGAEEEVIHLPSDQRRKARRDWKRVWLRKLPAAAAALLLLAIIWGFSSPMILTARKSLDGMDPPIVSYAAPADEMVDLMDVAEAVAAARGGEALPRELIEGTPIPMVLPQRTPFFKRREAAGQTAGGGLVTGGLRSGEAAPEPEVLRKPAAPSSSTARAIAANSVEPAAVPVPTVPPVGQAGLAFGDGDDFGDGWAEGGSGGGGGGVSMREDVPTLGRLFDNQRGNDALASRDREEGKDRDRNSSLAGRESLRRGAALTEEHAENVDQVRRRLYTGQGNFDLGKFDEAKAAYEEVLRIDPHNKAARRGLERVGAATSDYDRAAYDQTRAELLTEVDSAWERAVPADERLKSEMAEIRKALEEPSISDSNKQELYRQWRERNEKLEAARVGRTPRDQGGISEADQAASAGNRFADLEAERIKLESQIDTLLRYDGEQLTTYASGLKLPDNSVKETHPKWLEARRQLEAAKVRGLGAEHPEVQARTEEVRRLEKELNKETAAIRETLRAQLNLVNEQKSRLESVVERGESEAVTHGIARHSFDDARIDFENAQSLLGKLKIKQIGEEMQRRISEDPVVVHKEAEVEVPGLLSLDRRAKGSAVVQVRPAMPSGEAISGMVHPTFFPTEVEVVKARGTLKEAIEIGRLKERTGKSEEQLVEELKNDLEVGRIKGTDLLEIRYRNRDKDLTRDVVEAVTEAYRKRRAELDERRAESALVELREAVSAQEALVEEKRKVLSQMVRNQGVIYAPRASEASAEELPEMVDRASVREQRERALDLMAEVAAEEEPFSTFSLNVSDASFRLAVAALGRGEQPDSAGIRPEEFYNAFDYGDPGPSAGEPVACTLEQAAHPAFPQRNLLRIAVRTGAAGRAQSVPLNLTLLLDNSGSMARPDRAEGVARAVEQLSSLLKPGDRVSVAGFARTPRLLADRLDGGRAAELNEIVRQVPAEGGTNLEQALVLGEELATRQFVAGAQNRVVLFTDGAANLGDADPESLNVRIDSLRQNGIAFDAAGFGADGLNDRLLERLTRNGNGRYYVVDDPAEADSGFADRLAGAFRPAAENVKVQVVFNPERVGRYKLIGFEEHRLKKEDFRDDTVDAAEMAAEEAGVALYQMEVLPDGRGEVGEVRVRFRDAASGDMVERSWTIPYARQAPAFDRAAESIQLAALAAFTAERLRDAPMSGLVDFKELATAVGRVAAKYGESERVDELRRMIEVLR